jgi:hypothetical protein
MRPARGAGTKTHTGGLRQSREATFVVNSSPFWRRVHHCGTPNMTAITAAIAINAHNVQKARALIISAAPIPSSARRVPTGYEECHVFFRMALEPLWDDIRTQGSWLPNLRYETEVILISEVVRCLQNTAEIDDFTSVYGENAGRAIVSHRNARWPAFLGITK